MTGCGPSRAAFQVGTLAAYNYNENATQVVWSYSPETGFVGGLPPEMMTLPKALKEYARSIGEDLRVNRPCAVSSYVYSILSNYALVSVCRIHSSYAGKWGLQGATWTNSSMGAGYVSVYAADFTSPYFSVALSNNQDSYTPASQ